MYIFVRFTGILLVIFGALLMLAGFGGALYLLIQKNTLVDTLNAYLLSSGGRSVVTGDFLTSLAIYALAFFLTGLLTAAFAQRMPTAGVDRRAPLKVRQAKGHPPIPTIGGAKQRKQRLVLVNGQQLPIAQCPALGRETK